MDDSNAAVVRRYPDWKHLYDVLLKEIEGGKTQFTYGEVQELVGFDLQLPFGRGQFYRARRELLKTRQLWLENVPREGYAVIEAKDHSPAAQKRMKQARRKVKMGLDINTNVDFMKLTPEQRLINAATGAMLTELSKSFRTLSNRFQLQSKRITGGEIRDIDLPQLLESIAENAKPKKGKKS